jgi:DNA-binding response OmpR family regulator
MMSATSWRHVDVERARELGAEKYLFRPIEPQSLLQEIEPYLKRCSNE